MKKKFISDLPTLIFSRYETGTTGIFFLHLRQIISINFFLLKITNEFI
jgi:hypothetical protein